MKRIKRLIFLGLVSLVLFVSGFFVILSLPNELKYLISDTYERVTGPAFTTPFNSFVAEDKSKIIAKYRELGYKLRCFENVKGKHKLGEFNDSLCWVNINSVYDEIPARHLAFFFYKERLLMVRLEVPASSFDELDGYFEKTFPQGSRLDSSSGRTFGVDQNGVPLKVWKLKGGTLTTNTKPTQGEPSIILWTAHEAYYLKTLKKLGFESP